MEINFNPLKYVDGEVLPPPSSYTYNLEDVSSSDAGRTEDILMHKNTIGRVKSLNLSWKNITTEQVSQILQAFSRKEYYSITYLDALTGGYVTEEFYTGNRSAPLYNARLGLWQNVTFNVIKRSGK